MSDELEIDQQTDALFRRIAACGEDAERVAALIRADPEDFAEFLRELGVADQPDAKRLLVAVQRDADWRHNRGASETLPVAASHARNPAPSASVEARIPKVPRIVQKAKEAKPEKAVEHTALPKGVHLVRQIVRRGPAGRRERIRTYVGDPSTLAVAGTHERLALPTERIKKVRLVKKPGENARLEVTFVVREAKKPSKKLRGYRIQLGTIEGIAIDAQSVLREEEKVK